MMLWRWELTYMYMYLLKSLNAVYPLKYAHSFVTLCFIVVILLVYGGEEFSNDYFSCAYIFFSCDQAALWMVQSVCPSVRPSVCPSVCHTFLAATKQLYEWFSPSVRLSVCPSVCPSVRLSHLFDYVPINVSSWNFQELLPMTKVTSMQKVKVRGQRSRSQRSRPNLTVSGL